MNDIIKLPANATRADFAPYLDAGEASGYIAETESGKKHVQGKESDYAIGQRIVRFERVTSGGRRSSVHEGWRKVVTPYVIEGVGAAYRLGGETVRNFYVREA